MMKDEKKDIEIINVIAPEGKLLSSRCGEVYLEKHGYASYLRERFSDNTTDCFAEIICRLFNGIETAPVCKNKDCQNIIKFDTSNKRYSNYCCPKCRNNSEEVLAKNKAGVSKALKKVYEERGDEVKEKRAKTLKEHYGCDKVSSPFSIKEVQEKAKATIFENHGVDNVMKLKEYHKDVRKISRQLSVELWKQRGLNIEYVGDDEIVIKNGCKVHGNIHLSLSDFNNRTKEERMSSSVVCPLCNPINEFSGEEKSMKDFLDSLNIEFETNTRNIIPPKELDFYFPQHNLAIEMNGLYFHGLMSERNKYYHRDKTGDCEKRGIQLIHLWEDDWNDRQDIVKSILKNKFGKIDRKIYARDCEVKEIDSETLRNFLIANHLQGNINSSIKFGLFFGEELVSVMSFGQKRICLGSKSDKEEVELYRFCNKINTAVVGGASKLFSYAKKYLQSIGVKTIITYAKRDWSNGNVYKTLGFDFVGYTEPNYFYLNKSKEKKGRFACRKSIIATTEEEMKLSENEIMHNKGYFRCYDSGNMKFIYKL